MTSKLYVESKYAKDKKAKDVLKIILDNQFWNDCHVIMHIVSSLIINYNEQLAMGYVYDGMHRANDGIQGKEEILGAIC